MTEKSPGTLNAGGSGRSMTVLVVDDNDIACRLCRRVLEKAGHNVLTAADGLEGVSLALAHSPDLVFMDVAMPRMDGVEAMRRIKKQRPGTIIVIASVLASEKNREWFLAAGADDVLIKPLRLRDLTAAVDRVINSGPAVAPTWERRKGIPEELRQTVRQATEVAAMTKHFPVSTTGGKPQFDFGEAAAFIMGFEYAVSRARQVLGEIAHAYGALPEYLPVEDLDAWHRLRLALGTELKEVPSNALLGANKSGSRLYWLDRSIALEANAATKEQRAWSWRGAERTYTLQIQPAVAESSRCDWVELVQGKYLHELAAQSHALIDLLQRQLVSPPKPNRQADLIRRPGSAHEEHVYGAYQWCAVCGWVQLMASPNQFHAPPITPIFFANA